MNGKNCCFEANSSPTANGIGVLQQAVHVYNVRIVALRVSQGVRIRVRLH